jgi:hypothetical protein
MNYFLSNPFRAPHKVWNPNKIELKYKSMPSLEEIRISQNPPEFDEIDQFAKNRMVFGSFRYGLMEKQSLDGYDHVNEIHKRVNLYEKDHNLEHLVDALNMVKMSYRKGKLRGESMNPTDDGYHATPK